MSWMDLSDYLVIEESAAARIDDLHDDAAADAAVEIPAPARADSQRARISACDWLRSTAIEAR
jgi:hypothetical protein